MMVWSLTWSQTSWNVKSSGPWKASLWTKLVGVMELQLSYFKSKKMMLWKYCTQYASKFGKLSSGHRTGKGQFSFQSPRKAMPKNAQTTVQLHSSHALEKEMATHFSTLAWKIPWMEEPGRPQPMGSQIVGHNWATSLSFFLTSVWDECNCVGVWAFFGIAFLWNWNENWPFPVLWPLLSFPNLMAYWVQYFHSIIFQDLK